MISGDPRLSFEERYASQDDYVRKVEQAATALQRQRLLLDEDVRAWWMRRASPTIGR
jgi:hypothetical protein